MKQRALLENKGVEKYISIIVPIFQNQGDNLNNDDNNNKNSKNNKILSFLRQKKELGIDKNEGF